MITSPMRIAYFLVASSILISGVASGQVLKGTFDVLTNDTLTIKHTVSGVSENASELSVEGGIYGDASLRQSSLVRHVPVKKIQHRGKDTQGNYDLVADFTVESGGVYYFAMNIRATGLNSGGEIVRGQPFWKITSRWPVIPVTPDSNYLYGQTAYLNIAAGHQDYSGYGFAVKRGSNHSVLFSGTSSIVPVDSIWRIDSTLADTTFDIEGLYKGRPFVYMDKSSNHPVQSVWTIHMSPPAPPQPVTLWTAADKFDEAERKFRIPTRLPRVDMGLKEGWITASRFRFSCIAQISASDIMMINPEADNIRVKSEPPGFLLPRRFQKTMDGVWTVVDVLPNPEFLRGLTPLSMQKVTIVIDMVDKFNRVFQFRYKTQVFSSENP